MAKHKIYSWKCDDCGRILESLYPNQLKQWRETHLITHEIKRVSTKEEE